MKSIYNFTVCFVFLFFSAEMMNAQKIIAQWDFNGTNDTSIAGGASPSPNIGNGTASLIGVTSPDGKDQYGNIVPGSGGFDIGSTTDPETVIAYNFGWVTTSYAAAGAENKARGVQFNINTSGYKGLTFSFDQRLSNTANDTYVVQYAANKNSPQWVDVKNGMFTLTPTATTGDTWYTRNVDLSSITELDNNPNAAIRIVSAFDPKTGNYNAATLGSTYTASKGKVRFDMVTFKAAQTLGIADNVYSAEKFSFYPNPTNGNFIYFNRSFSVRIFDMLGKTILSAKDVSELNLESLSSGLYFIENEDRNVIKMIKN